MAFWIMVDIFNGITTSRMLVQAGLGVVWGVIVLGISRVVRFFTLPENPITMFVVSTGLALVILTFYNFSPFAIYFSETFFPGYSNGVITIGEFTLSTVGNIVGGGIILGLMSGSLLTLEEDF
jgi:hypothetical protein